MQTSIFEYMYPNYKITKPIRLIEFFAGYGSQALALKYLNIPFEHWRTCEWAIKSIQAYVVMKDLRIRNLTPKEMGRLMGVKDEDIDKLTISDSAKTHCFGDSIVVNVLMAIFKEMM